jgi:HPt (histidine-containing phosphotransfer) domain-containing protein
MTNDEDGKIEALLTDLWQRQLPLLKERLDLLDHTAADASTGILAEASRVEALSVAHKLSGSLGMFGHHKGTDTARMIEQALRTPTPEALGGLGLLARTLREILRPHL